MKRTFTMNGKTYESMMDIARELGVKRVYPKDFEKLGIKELDENTPAPTTEPEAVEPETKAETKEVKTKKPEAKKSEPEAKKAKESKPVEKDIMDDWKAAGEVDNTLSLEEFAKKLRKADIADLETFAKAKDLNLYTDVQNAPIRRMRIIMELKGFYYPDEKLETKKSSGFRKIALDKLVAKAAEGNLEYRLVGNEAIQRMWVTKALIEAGITPEDIEPKKDTTKTKVNGGEKK